MGRPCWIQTWGGGKFDVLNPRPEDINIEAMAVGLARTYRFRGQTISGITVAQHSVEVSRRCPTTPLRGLLHDASEWVLGDVSSPQKCQDFMAGYRAVESHVQRVIYEWAGVANQPDDEVKYADGLMVRLEAESPYGLHTIRDGWVDQFPKPTSRDVLTFYPWEPAYAAEVFVSRFKELCPKHR
jgi:hypothetical protein